MPTTHTRRSTAPPALAPLALLLAACGPTSLPGTAAPAGSGQSTASATSASAAATQTAAPSSPSTAPVSTSPTAGAGGATGKGCPAGGPAVPKKAGTARTADLDGDGRPDTIWLADVGEQRTLGVRTASGAVFSTVFTSAAPQSAGAVAGQVRGGRVILLDTGRSVPLYAVIGCRIVPSLNPQGRQYTFDLGFTGFGSGVGCPVIGGVRQLAGYLAEPDGQNDDTVSRTTIVLASGGSSARNGTTTVLGRHLATDSALVRQAHTVTCGTSGQALEPQF